MCTHYSFAFADIEEIFGNELSNGIEPLTYSKQIYNEFNSLKMKNSTKKTFISVSLSRIYHKFIKLQSEIDKNKFVFSIEIFLEKYQFDGIDLHWVSLF